MDKEILNTKILYDKDYYENGVEKGISGYTNYRWIPELTIPLAYRIIKYLKIKDNETVLDYGCAKGFLVKALRLLDIETYGFDVSKYAIENAPKDISKFLYKELSELENKKFDWIIAKDVFEHISKPELLITLKFLLNISKKLFCIVPLAENGKYIAQANEMDVSHKIKENFNWWKMILSNFGNKMKLCTTKDIGNFKSNYIDIPKSHGFFIINN